MQTKEQQIKILVVESDPAQLQLIRRLFGGTNGALFELEYAERIAQAIELLHSESIDVILLNMSMPDCEGLNALHSIRYAAPGRPIIVITPQMDEVLGARLLREGAQWYLSREQLENELISSVLQHALDRQRMEAAIRESEFQYRNAIDFMADAIHLVDRDLHIVLMNKTFKGWMARLGIDNHCEGKDIFEVFPFLAPQVRQEYESVFLSGESVVTEEANRVNGNSFLTETRKIPVFRNGTVVQVITVIRDITERKQFQDELVEKERFLSGVFPASRTASASSTAR